MIANVNPSSASFEETLNTLKYANRAKNIKTSVQRNVLNVNYHISEYVSLISNLRGEIKLLKEQMDTKDQPGDDFAPPLVVDVRGSLEHPPLHPGRNGPQSPNTKNIPSTPLLALRESLKSNGLVGAIPQGAIHTNGFGNATMGQDRELVNGMRQNIVDNFQERMQLRRSLIELEDQNVQNSIEIGKRQLLVVQWSHHRGYGGVGEDASGNGGGGPDVPSFTNKSDFTADLVSNGSGEVKEAWVECEQLRKACVKNNGMKRNIAKRLRHNEKEAEKFRYSSVYIVCIHSVY